MMVEEINASVKKNRNWAVLGIGVGIVLIVAYFGFEMIMSVERPPVQGTNPKVIVSYISNPRGLEKLAEIEQRQFLEEWQSYLMSDAEAKDALKAHLKDLTSADRKAFLNSMLMKVKGIVMDDARQFERMTSADRNKFMQKKAVEFESQSAFIKELALLFGSEAPSPERFQSWVFEKTTPKEREIATPYLEAVHNVIDQLRTQRRNQSVAANP